MLYIDEFTKYEISKILGEDISTVQTIRYKDKVLVARIFTKTKSYVIKYFEDKKYTREVSMYKLFIDLNIRTPKVYYTCDNFILMEDITTSNEYRLANENDLKNNETIKNLALWYKELHTKGLSLNLKNFYSEFDLITTQNIKSLKNIINAKTIDFLLKNLKKLKKLQKKVNFTLTYNDFAFENMIVGKNVAFMFDYNFCGKGTAFSDILNIFSMLDDDMKKTFLEAYGKSDFGNFEISFTQIYTTLASIIIANKKDTLPTWANKLVDYINSPSFLKAIEDLH